jgi:hypothetical protein
VSVWAANQQIIGADRPAGALEARAQAAVDGVRRGLERQDLEGVEDRFGLRGKAPIPSWRRHSGVRPRR